MKLTIAVLAFVLMFAPAAFANHTSNGGHSNSHAGNTHTGTHPTAPSHERGRVNNDRHFNHKDFGRDHITRFRQGEGRWFGRGYGYGYQFGGLWFYYNVGPWPYWFYNCDVFFDIRPDGLWYATCATDPGLSIQVGII